MAHTTDEITVDPQGQSMVVDIFDMNGVSVTCYTASGGSSAFTLPATITGETSFYLTDGGYYDVSAKLGGVEIAGVGGTKARVQAAQGVPVRVTPVIDQIEQLVEAASPGGSTQVAVHKTTTYTAANGDVVLADASGASFTVTLPAPAANSSVTVKNVGATGTVTIAPHAAEHIDGATSLVLSSQFESRDLLSDGTDWWVL